MLLHWADHLISGKGHLCSMLPKRADHLVIQSRNILFDSMRMNNSTNKYIVIGGV